MEVIWLEIYVLLLTLFASIIAIMKWNYRYWERMKVPFSKPKFPMGNFESPWAIKKGFHGTIFDVYKEFKTKGYKYGGIFSFVRPVFVPLDLDLLKCILIKDFQYFVDRGVYYHEEADPLSTHMLSAEGDKWRSLRTRLSPTFTSGKMKYMFQNVMYCADALELEINKLDSKKQPVDIKEMAGLFTINVIGSCAFGLDLDNFGNLSNEFRLNTKMLMDGSVEQSMRNFVTFSFPKLCKKLRITIFPKKTTKYFSDVVRNIIHQRETGNVKRSDFLQLLVDINNKTKNSETIFTFEEIAAQAFFFFIAGFETSSSTIAFAFYEMAKNQKIQDKVRAEIRSVLEKYDNKITYEAIKEMKYLNQVFEETLRKYPIAATLERIVTKDYKVPGDDLILKKGTKVLVPLLGIQNDPEFYPNPEKFDPDRFLYENIVNRHVCAYMPFGEGPRFCIGKRFGIMQTKIGMAVMLRNFKYTLNSRSPEMCFNNKAFLLSPEGEVLLNIEKVN